MNAVDTNVLLYFVDNNEPAKQAKAMALLADLGTKSPGETLLIWQVVVEFAAGLKRREDAGKGARKDRLDHWARCSTLFPIMLPQSNLVPIAYDLLDRHSLSYWDALLLAACIEAGVDTLYSEDLSDGVSYDSVKVVNPFV